jgi:hypothetical protein
MLNEPLGPSFLLLGEFNCSNSKDTFGIFVVISYFSMCDMVLETANMIHFCNLSWRCEFSHCVSAL